MSSILPLRKVFISTLMYGSRNLWEMLFPHNILVVAFFTTVKCEVKSEGKKIKLWAAKCILQMNILCTLFPSHSTLRALIACINFNLTFASAFLMQPLSTSSNILFAYFEIYKQISFLHPTQKVMQDMMTQKSFKFTLTSPGIYNSTLIKCCVNYLSHFTILSISIMNSHFNVYTWIR